MGVCPTACVMFSSAPFIIGFASQKSRSTSGEPSLPLGGTHGIGQTALLMTSAFDAIVLIAHGARDARWMEPFYAMRAEIAERLAGQQVALAFMEFAKPTFPEAVAEVCRATAGGPKATPSNTAAGGPKASPSNTTVHRVLVVPIFLSGGGHVAGDIPALVRTEQARYPKVEFAIAGAIGEEREVAAGMIDAVTRLAAPAGGPKASPSNTGAGGPKASPSNTGAGGPKASPSNTAAGGPKASPSNTTAGGPKASPSNTTADVGVHVRDHRSSLPIRLRRFPLLPCSHIDLATINSIRTDAFATTVILWHDPDEKGKPR